MWRPLSPVPLDLALHLLVFAPLGCREKRDARHTRGQLQRVTALSATNTAQHKSDIPNRIWRHALFQPLARQTFSQQMLEAKREVF
jgi:hypothetical protein